MHRTDKGEAEAVTDNPAEGGAALLVTVGQPEQDETVRRHDKERGQTHDDVHPVGVFPYGGRRFQHCPSAHEEKEDDGEQYYRREQKDIVLRGEPVLADDGDGVQSHDNVHGHVHEAYPGTKQEGLLGCGLHDQVAEDDKHGEEAAEEGAEGQKPACIVSVFQFPEPQLMGADKAGRHFNGGGYQSD